MSAILQKWQRCSGYAAVVPDDLHDPRYIFDPVVRVRLYCAELLDAEFFGSRGKYTVHFIALLPDSDRDAPRILRGGGMDLYPAWSKERGSQCCPRNAKKTISTMFVGYAGLLVFLMTLFVMIVLGKTDLPVWGCICNTLVFMLAMLPTKLPAKGNIAGALMYLGLLFLI